MTMVNTALDDVYYDFNRDIWYYWLKRCRKKYADSLYNMLEKPPAVLFWLTVRILSLNKDELRVADRKMA